MIYLYERQASQVFHLLIGFTLIGSCSILFRPFLLSNLSLIFDILSVLAFIPVFLVISYVTMTFFAALFPYSICILFMILLPYLPYPGIIFNVFNLLCILPMISLYLLYPLSSIIEEKGKSYQYFLSFMSLLLLSILILIPYEIGLSLF